MKLEPLSHREISQICRSLSLLLHSGITLADGLFLLAQEETGQRKSLLTGLGQRLDEGVLLSAAMEESTAFPASVTGMIRIGEHTGQMEETLSALADFHEERHRTGKRIKNALAYPSLILLLMLSVVAVLLIKVLPVFDDVYASLGSRLTGIAAGLLHLGQLLEAALPILLVLLAGIVLLVLLYACWGAFRSRVTALFQIRFGDRGVNAKFNNARFARALAMGLGSGLPLEYALELSGQLLSDIPAAAARCRLCAARMEAGVSLSDAMGEANLLNAAHCRLLSVGLRSGSGDQVMAQIAETLMEEAEESLETTVSRVEPAMVLISSALVGLILLSVMLPLMNIMSSIG